MPNKTIYVSDGDLHLYQRAQELGGGNLSAAIATALRRFVEAEEGRVEGFDQIVVRVGPGKGKGGRKVRFTGVLLGEWTRMVSGREDTVRLYRSRTGKFVVYTVRGPGFETRDAQGRPAGWRGYLGIGDLSWGSSSGAASIEVVDTVEALRAKLPAELWEMVALAVEQPAVEDLDI